jgi:hypothetical protein
MENSPVGARVEFLTQAPHIFKKELLALPVISQSLQELPQACRAVPVCNRL